MSRNVPPLPQSAPFRSSSARRPSMGNFLPRHALEETAQTCGIRRFSCATARFCPGHVAPRRTAFQFASFLPGAAGACADTPPRLFRKRTTFMAKKGEVEPDGGDEQYADEQYA